ncbi:hypothetical protein E2C01_073382 [Portunus trituberculatus]|uniref:Uncharacterized protein n=1 Tax=Portunus trituberculatus TaxID=210409 RepID=A0A5B7I2V0_PORTR|nr:hypothetical protein [Portunus trituberculatus]
MDRPVRNKLPKSKYTDEAQGVESKSIIQSMSPSPGTSVQGRLVMLEEKFEDLVKELKVQRSEDEQDREFRKALKERVRRLEENEKRLEDENAHLREEVEKYKRQLEFSRKWRSCKRER